jgi:predicted N-acetyltransferase YhbS
MTKKAQFSQPILLTNNHDTTIFNCGVTGLNLYLQKYALTNNYNQSVKTFVSLNNQNQVIGYYSLVAGGVEHFAVPPRIKKGLGKYPIPVILIARLAVDISCQKIGLGKGLLKDALLRCLSIIEHLGVRAILVHAKDDQAKQFYQKFGFESSPIDEYHLYLLVKDIQKMLTV